MEISFSTLEITGLKARWASLFLRCTTLVLFLLAFLASLVTAILAMVYKISTAHAWQIECEFRLFF